MEVPLMKKRSFVKTGENIISSYSYSDVVEGSGFVDFYLGTTNATAGVAYIMDTSVWRTESSDTTTNLSHGAFVGNMAGAGPTTAIDLDFDSKIYNRQVTLYGTATFTFRMFVATTGAGAAGTMTPTIYLRRYNATEGEVEIANVVGETVSNGGVNAVLGRNYALRVAVPKTLIKRGDILRVTISGVVSGAAGGTTAIGVAYHPEDSEQARTSGARTMTWEAGNSRAMAKIPYMVQD